MGNYVYSDCPVKGTSSLDCLRSSSSDALIRAGGQLVANRTSTIFIFAPMVDGNLVPRRPTESYNMGAFLKVPTLFGYNSNEGRSWTTIVRDPAANTATVGADRTTIFHFLKGQYNDVQQSVVDDAVLPSKLNLYPLSEYGSLTRQAEQLYGELRYICTPILIIRASRKARLEEVFQYQ